MSRVTLYDLNGNIAGVLSVAIFEALSVCPDSHGGVSVVKERPRKHLSD